MLKLIMSVSNKIHFKSIKASHKFFCLWLAFCII